MPQFIESDSEVKRVEHFCSFSARSVQLTVGTTCGRLVALKEAIFMVAF